MHPKDTDRIANSVDADQTSRSVSVRSTLFAMTCPSEYLGSLCYVVTGFSKVFKCVDSISHYSRF